MLERVEAISRIRTVVNRTLGEPGRGVVGQVMSADTVLATAACTPATATVRSEPSSIASYWPDDKTLRDNDYLRLEKSDGPAESELWRISLRVAALSDVDYGYFISTLQRICRTGSASL